MELKRCGRCRHYLPRRNFNKDRGQPDGLQNWCRRCKKEHTEQHPPKPKERLTVGEKDLRAYEYNQKMKLLDRARDEFKLRGRIGFRTVRYGVSLPQYAEMFDRQHGRCAICRRRPTEERKGALQVDHCHRTGKIRGLLCFSCNLALGHFLDDPEILRRAARYVTTHED